ncbi:MAG: diaminopimelate epimerase [Actinomycetota bacterium]
MRFGKYQGIGNDFVMLSDPEDRLRLTPELVRSLCDRRTGVGADGVIRVAPGIDGADFFMDHVNSDGTTSEMCGNGIRCLAIFAADEGLSAEEQLKVMTRAGLKVVERSGTKVRVDMGAPMFAPAEVPINWSGDDALEARLDLDGKEVALAAVSLGNPHAVLFVPEIERAPVTTLGPRLETHPAFPNRTNVEFAVVETPERIRMRVWERGAGETMACGTGACAVAVVARLRAGTSERVTVALPGGELEVAWAGDLEREAPVYMTGPAVRSFVGEVEIEDVG